MVKSRAYPRTRQTTQIVREKTNFLREWRERPTEEFPDGMGQETLADRSGLSVSSVSAYERSENDPSLDALAKLSKALGVPKGMLLDVDPREDPELWDAYLRADAGQREALGRMASGLVGPPKAKKRK
jgi:transcriptional regulator with XRE-family HTH domain